MRPLASSIALALPLLLGFFGVGCGPLTIRVAEPRLLNFIGEPRQASDRGVLTRQGTNLFRAECPEFLKVGAEQQGDEWCWAACAQMLRAYAGESLSQSVIAARIHGASDPQAARFDEIMLALNPDLDTWWEEQKFETIPEKVFAQGLRVNISPFRIIDEELYLWMTNGDNLVYAISAGQPVVLGLRGKTPDGEGHIVVAFAVTYSEAELSQWELIRLQSKDPRLRHSVDHYAIHSVEIFDPAPGAGYQQVSATELNERIDFMLTQEEARGLLEDRHSMLGFR